MKQNTPYSLLCKRSKNPQWATARIHEEPLYMRGAENLDRECCKSVCMWHVAYTKTIFQKKKNNNLELGNMWKTDINTSFSYLELHQITIRQLSQLQVLYPKITLEKGSSVLKHCDRVAYSLLVFKMRILMHFNATMAGFLPDTYHTFVSPCIASPVRNSSHCKDCLCARQVFLRKYLLRSREL